MRSGRHDGRDSCNQPRRGIAHGPIRRPEGEAALGDQQAADSRGVVAAARAHRGNRPLGLFYFWQNCLPDAESALHFSGASYTTIGFGDVVLPKPWRMFGPIEGLTGMLGGLSAGLFVTLVNGIFAADSSRRHETADR